MNKIETGRVPSLGDTVRIKQGEAISDPPGVGIHANVSAWTFLSYSIHERDYLHMVQENPR
jgi:hypothetical protein